MTTTITKGPAGGEDRWYYDGVNESFTRLSSSGQTLTLHPMGGEVDVLAAYGGKVNYTDTSIIAALTAIGTTNKRCLVLRPGLWTLSTNRDWSAYTNITFKFLPGAIILQGAYTLNIPNIDAGVYQIFSGTGTITISGPVKKVYPEWFGAAGDDSTDDAIAIQAAINSIPNGGIVEFQNRTYRFGSTLVVSYGHITLKGVRTTWVGQKGTILNANFVDADALQIQGTDWDHRIGYNIVRGLTIQRTSTATTTGSGILVEWTSQTYLEDVTLMDHATAVLLSGTVDPFLDRCKMGRTVDVGSDSYGVYIDGTRYNWSVSIKDCTVSFTQPSSATMYGVAALGTYISDIWIDGLNTGGCSTGIYLAATGSVYADIQIFKCIFDQFQDFGIRIDDFGKDATVSIVGGWFAPRAKGSSNTAVLVYNSYGVKVIGAQFRGDANYGDATAILANGTGGYNSFIGNIIRNFGVGIQLENDFNVVTGNSLYNGDSYIGDYLLRLTDSAVNNVIAANSFNGYSSIGIATGAGCNNNIFSANQVDTTYLSTPVSDSGTGNIFAHNTGFLVENSGATSAIASGATVAHGLDVTPSVVLVTPSVTGLSDIYVSEIGATTFKINYAGGGTNVFYWKAMR